MSNFGELRKHQNNPACTKSVKSSQSWLLSYWILTSCQPHRIIVLKLHAILKKGRRCGFHIHCATSRCPTSISGLGNQNWIQTCVLQYTETVSWEMHSASAFVGIVELVAKLVTHSLVISSIQSTGHTLHWWPGNQTHVKHYMLCTSSLLFMHPCDLWPHRSKTRSVHALDSRRGQ